MYRTKTLIFGLLCFFLVACNSGNDSNMPEQKTRLSAGEIAIDLKKADKFLNQFSSRQNNKIAKELLVTDQLTNSKQLENKQQQLDTISKNPAVKSIVDAVKDETNVDTKLLGNLTKKDLVDSNEPPEIIADETKKIINRVQSALASGNKENFDYVSIPITGLGVLEDKKTGEVVFISENGRYLITGQLLDLLSKQFATNMLEIRKAVEYVPTDIFKTDYAEFSSFSFGSGNKQLFIFVDAQCKQCIHLARKVQAESSQLSEYKFNFIVIPAIDELSNLLAKKVFCSKDQDKSAQLFLTEKLDQLEIIKNCDLHSYNLRLFQLQALAINGVPFSIGYDGKIIRGFEANSIKNWLALNGQ